MSARYYSKTFPFDGTIVKARVYRSPRNVPEEDFVCCVLWANGTISVYSDEIPHAELQEFATALTDCVRRLPPEVKQ